MEVYSHAGDIGDVIYALPTIKALGGGKLVLFDQPGKTAHGMTPAKMERMRPLLEMQPYIHGVEFNQHVHDTNINGFRDHYRHGNLADMHLATHGLSWKHRRAAWLEVDRVESKHEVIVHWTPRYGNERFPWERVTQEYQDCGFIGLAEEHEQFESMFGKIARVEAYDFLQLARLIAGSKLFVGNQSSPLAVAHGLKHPTVMCVSPGANQHHCVFQRMNCVIGWDEKIEWPIL